MKRRLLLHFLPGVIETPSPEASASQIPATLPAPTSTSTNTPEPIPTEMPTTIPTPTVFVEGMPENFFSPALDPELNEGSSLAITGEYVSDLVAFDEAMTTYMKQNKIQVGTLAVLHNGEIVLNHGYGWRDAEKTIPVPATPMRIASTKPITSAAIRQLIGKGDLNLGTKVFCQNEKATGCVLYIEPLPDQEVDPRIYSITIDHLLSHKGGWDSDSSQFDPMFESVYIAAQLKIESPPDKHQIAQYMLGRPLDFTPGTREAYSNFGFSLLGLVIEKVTGQPYLDSIQEQIFTPLEIKDIELAHTLPEKRSPLEPEYNCPGKGQNVFSPYEDACWGDGGWYIEAMDSHGGLITSSKSIALFLNQY